MKEFALAGIDPKSLIRMHAGHTLKGRGFWGAPPGMARSRCIPTIESYLSGKAFLLYFIREMV
jgi:hypothetical protein